MSKEIRTILLGAAALAASLSAGAQTAVPAPASASAQQAAPTTSQAAPYNSAFESYRPFAAEEVGDWRKANDTVREIGGWRAYAREIQGGATSQPGAVAPAGAQPAQPQAQQQSQPAGQGAAVHPAPAAPAALAPSAAPARPSAPANPHQGHAR